MIILAFAFKPQRTIYAIMRARYTAALSIIIAASEDFIGGDAPKASFSARCSLNAIRPGVSI
jgi:hypothetical protein